MNLLASYDWLKEYVDLKETPEQFAARVSLSGPGVEKILPMFSGLEKIVVGHVTSVGSHPNADKLRIATVDVGTQSTGPLQIVCGGSNLKADQWVAVAMIGSKVRWHGEGEPVELKPTEIRGVKSDGMICGANEIGLFDAFPSGEREILDLQVALGAIKLKPGTPLDDALGGANDVALDVEITTNRPDAMGIVGLAREASAILKRPFTWEPSPKIKAGKSLLKVNVGDKKLCLRYLGVRVDGVKVSPSPWWLKRRLLSAGLRPVNSLVDITNFVLYELGQPMHVFDADKISGGRLEVRKAKVGESIAALDGKTYKLDDTMLVVADAEKPVAVAGVMGGEETAVTSDTKSIIFEAATFDPVSVRRTARKLNLYSDSQLRFEKGLSTEAPPFALARAVELCLELAGGEVTSTVTDVKAATYKAKTFSIKTTEIANLMGVELTLKEMKDILHRLGFKLQATSYQIQATIPWWRDHDIESGRDLVEEIARVYGYAHLPPVFPVGLSNRQRTPELRGEERLRALAKGAGLTETYTYSFVSKELLQKAGYDATSLLRIQNPLSSDFEYMRTTLLPSLLQVVAENQERFRSQKLFEIAHVYYPRSSLRGVSSTNDAATSSGRRDEIASQSLAMTELWSDLPDEQLELGCAFLSDDSAWKQAKGFVEYLYREFGISDVTWKKLDNDAFWHPGRSVQAFVGEHLLGTVGEVNPAIAEAFKIEGRLALIDVPLEEVFEIATAKRYVPITQFPEAKRDLALTIDRDAEAQSIIELIRETSPLIRSVEWFDTYRGKGITEGKKSVAFHLTFSQPDRTLETNEVETAMGEIEKKLKERMGAEIRR